MFHSYHRAVLLLCALLLALTVPALPASAQTTSAEPFAEHYWRYHGAQTLGAVHSPLLEINGYRMQYFEKGRLEDHRHLTGDLSLAVAYSPLTIELMQTAPDLPIAGLPVTYGDLGTTYAGQLPPPAGFQGGPMHTEQGMFVPVVDGTGGYIVPFQFWTYINRQHLFPGGWMHTTGLPLTNAFTVLVPGPDGSEKSLIIQPFERAVLALDLAERYDWQVERLNIGTDAAWVYGMQPQYQPHAPPPAHIQASGEAKRIEVDLGQQWLFAYEGDQLILHAPVSSGKDGFETPTGRWTIYSRYQQKTLRGSYNGETWNVPDVPSVMFYYGGFAIHGVYWHDRFGTGERHSHGCVGLAPYDAATLFEWAPLGTPVIVR